MSAHPKENRAADAAIDKARLIAQDIAARREQRAPESPRRRTGGESVSLEPLYERYIDRKTGTHIVVPIARTASRGGVTLTPMPPIFGARIRKGAPIRRSAPTGALVGASAGGKAGGPDLVWAGHLQKCVDEETGEVYYVPVVYIIEMAAAPNNKPVPK